MKKFIVLHADEDGDMSITFMTEKEIKKDFLSEEELPYKILDHLPNLGYEAGVLIIDGTIVVPKAVEKVTEWELPI